ncbi:MAG: aldose 1-epimerase [Hyphomonas oceanitis]|uniref:Aldose 1-epimerase n=1 Tax=Hyphomonas oceanitis SCH89 TaxID=1280953 RepID=A0A059G3F9_9PROT|nr:aldose 1-epimerase [Hyphomonas oceanitis]KDA01008.1 aldose 1-epimerase [Hyphomonas oceanitis SCH89]
MSNTDLTRTTASTLAVVRIAAHGYEVEIDAARGGRIVSASFEDVDVLRRDVTSGASSALESACFPLVPYSNRIRRGQFVFEGEIHQLALNWDGDEHVIHGEGWQRAWDVVEQDTARAVLRLTGAEGWPWPYECLQEITVSKAGIGLSLTLRNTGQMPMPAGLGFHPYFPRTASTRLQFDAKRIWPPLGDTAPTPQAPDSTNSFATLRPVSDCVLDHCFDGWSGTARITQADTGLDLTIKANGAATHCVVYTPANEPYFCFEPVTHCTGAFEADDQREAGLKVLQTGETLHLAITIGANRL